MSVGQKAERVLKLLLGMENRRVATALAASGFTAADADEGWTLLRSLNRGKRGYAGAGPVNAAVWQDLDEWENRWFPVASATLQRRFPAVHAKMFLNLSQIEGPNVILSVTTFLERIAALTDPKAGYGPEGEQAKKLLEARGLTDATLGEARVLLEGLGKLKPATEPLPSIEDEKAEIAKAEEALWAWYLEWSEVTRAVIKDRRMLRELGFLYPKRRAAEDEDAEEPIVPPVVSPTTPATATLGSS
jgi:hypothetical protein